MPARHSGGGFAIGPVVLWVVLGVVLAVVAVLLWRWYTNRLPRRAAGLAGVTGLDPAAPPPEPEAEPDEPTLRSGVERALQWLNSDRVPADAVLRAWIGLQETAEQSGIVRRPAETPTEFTTRIMSRVFADDRAIRTLLRFYLQVRFGEHEVTADDVMVVRTALDDLARSWDAEHASGQR
jgi:hypothetical protein